MEAGDFMSGTAKPVSVAAEEIVAALWGDRAKLQVLTRREATTVERPPFPAPYGWPEPVLVAVSNTAEILPVFQSLPNGDPLEYALARLMIETLYDNGWVLAKVVPAPG
jgi:hypothetical protein